MALTVTRSAASLSYELVQRQTEAVAVINATIGQKRTKYITAIAGQGMIYADKEAEAKAYLALDPAPADLTAFQWMPGEIGVTAPDAYQLAQVWMNTAALWRVVGPQIEQLRLSSIAQVQAATTVTAIDAILTSFHTATEAF